MDKGPLSNLSRRERQIMDAIYQLGRASAAEVRAKLPDPPSYSAVRAFLAILESKGYLKHAKEGLRYIYLPTQPRKNVGEAALRRVLHTFYEGSVEKTVAALLDTSESNLRPKEIRRIVRLIKQARKEGR